MAAITLATTAIALVPRFYHRWWWWDVLVHAVVAGLLAVWGRSLGVPPRVAWPALIVGMLAWEWLELATPLLYSPTRVDVLEDLTVNVVAFGTTSWAVARRAPVGETGRSTGA